VPEPGIKDTLNAFIYWQNPPRLTEDRRVNRIHPGQLIDIRLSVEKPAVSDSVVAPVKDKSDNNY